jgi:hypothetical protein
MRTRPRARTRVAVYPFQVRRGRGRGGADLQLHAAVSPEHARDGPRHAGHDLHAGETVCLAMWMPMYRAGARGGGDRGRS